MNVVWLILDALSFEATPFSEDGPQTMPRLGALAEESGVVFTNAYAPGTASPSSHAAMFTGELPSRAGMHEASPYYDSDLPTVGDVLGESYRSLLISHNPFIFNGLDRGFSRTDDLRGQQYMLFDEATDPHQFLRQHRDTPVPSRYLEFLRQGGRPIKSLLNGLSFKFHGWRGNIGQQSATRTDSVSHQYAEQMNDTIREFVNEDEDETFVVANYMDIHPPLDVSDEAIDRFAPNRSREKLPIGATSSEISDRIDAGDETIEADAEALYHAAIWDTDRTIGPLVRELLEDGTFVVITADHGSRFTGVDSLDDRRIHVPLVVFAPKQTPRTVEHTVSLRNLPATTMARLPAIDSPFDETDLLSVSDDQTVISEYIHDSSPTGNAVSAFGEFETIQYDIAGINGNTRLDWIDGAFTQPVETETEQELATVIEDLAAGGLSATESRIDYDQETQERLADLGYL